MKRTEDSLRRREEIRDYIRNERDPIVIKWKALGENIHREDARRANFVQRRLKEDSEIPSITIRKFIGTLRKAVRVNMRYKGGTPYSIIRNLFLYWDKDKHGSLGVNELSHVMHSIGCRLTDEDLRHIVSYYDNGMKEGEMSYEELLHDIGRGEPTIIEFTPTEDANDNALRFENVADDWESMPDSVTKFLEAFREFIARRMRVSGGTPQEHAMPAFLKYDKDIKGGLTPDQLRTSARQYLKLQMSEDQAKEIVRFYDRKFKGILEPTLFISDLCNGVQSMLHFSELSARQIASQKKAIAENPFTIKSFSTNPNKILEKFKMDALRVLDAKVYNIGGSKNGWLREAFRFWDPRDLGFLTHYSHLQGAVKRLGLTLPDEDAMCVMKEYDSMRNGTLDYNILIKDVVSSDPHFLHDATELDSMSPFNDASISSRAPKPATKGIERFKMAAEAYARKSQGRIFPRDVLHGTFLRFDRMQEGRLDYNGVKAVMSELGIRLNEIDLHTFITWFDTNGSDCLDYNELVRQLYGDDVTTRALRLPPVLSPQRDAKSKISDIVKAATSPVRTGAGSSQISALAMGDFAEKDRKTVGRSSPYSNKLVSLASPTSGSGFATAMPSDTLGLNTRTLERNLQDIESRAVKEARKSERRQQILEEKVAIQSKLESIERQKQSLLEEYRLAHKNKKKTTLIVV